MHSRYSIPDGIHKPSASVIAVLNESLNDHSEYLSHGQSPESEYIKLLRVWGPKRLPSTAD